MAATEIGQYRDGLSYSDTLDGQFAGGVNILYSSDQADPEPAVQEIIADIESKGFTLGGQLADEPFSKMIVIGRTISPVESTDGFHWVVNLQLGPKEKKTVATAADWVFSFSTTTAQTDTNLDSGGSLIEVGTLAGSEATPSGGPYTEVPQVTATVSKLVPSTKITASGQLTTNPFSTFSPMVGKLNSSPITIIDPAGVLNTVLDVGTTMLTNAQVRTPNEGGFFLVDYEFEWREDIGDWSAVVSAINPATGQPWQNIKTVQYKDEDGNYTPASVTSGIEKGCVGFSMYKTADLASLIT